MRTAGRTAAWAGVVAAIAGATAVFGQGRGEAADPGSLGALTTEVRELRLAVQQLAQMQSQTQALGVYLAAQQSRVLQVSSQLESVRKELDAIAGHASDVGARLADLEEQLPRVSDPMERSAIQDARREMRREHQAASAREQQARTRELELSQSLQTEESRWSALISRLEALTQR